MKSKCDDWKPRGQEHNASKIVTRYHEENFKSCPVCLTKSSGFRNFIEECLVQLFLKSQDINGADLEEAFGSLEQLPP